MGATIWGSAYEHMSDAERVAELNRLIARWREPGFFYVRPALVVPDLTNREGTGISPKHVHWVALQMQNKGFEPHNDRTGAGHDLPFLVREQHGAASELGEGSLAQWQRLQLEHPDLPPPQPAARDGDEFFCSLGNGHFFQALNLFGTSHRRLFRGEGVERTAPDRRYEIGDDVRLRSAVEEGVRSIVLRPGMAKAERKFVCQASADPRHSSPPPSTLHHPPFAIRTSPCNPPPSILHSPPSTLHPPPSTLTSPPPPPPHTPIGKCRALGIVIYGYIW